MARKKLAELTSTGLKRVLKNASGRVAIENLQRGVAITVLDKGQIIQIRPDNTRRVVRKQLANQPVRITETELLLD
ncbi:hypothetical protein J0X19_22955 [Hymenobacter sp. BT186]|uniref:Uncharacterized protein n=1 Tax=Hymenobacter telluris TaxID=2816474 RepID=A0A939JFV7_9BACT|nr:hypothetical protein [Hymenobacter telluris]MBW3376866.1 hypothetical protein [Hymenobacter norwichensis]